MFLEFWELAEDVFISGKIWLAYIKSTTQENIT